MLIFNSANSPFMVLWYLFLAFFGVVIVMNVISLLGKAFLTWRIKRLMRRKKPHEEKK